MENTSESTLKSFEKLISEYNFTRTLQIGNFIDAKDSTDEWNVAQIISMDAGYLRIHYDGWSEKYDEVFLTNSINCRTLK